MKNTTLATTKKHKEVITLRTLTLELFPENKCISCKRKICYVKTCLSVTSNISKTNIYVVIWCVHAYPATRHNLVLINPQKINLKLRREKGFECLICWWCGWCKLSHFLKRVNCEKCVSKRTVCWDKINHFQERGNTKYSEKGHN